MRNHGPGEIENADPDDDEDYDVSPDDREPPPLSLYEEFWSDPCWTEPLTSPSDNDRHRKKVKRK